MLIEPIARSWKAFVQTMKDPDAAPIHAQPVPRGDAQHGAAALSPMASLHDPDSVPIHWATNDNASYASGDPDAVPIDW